jgi:hypothetical protein
MCRFPDAGLFLLGKPNLNNMCLGHERLYCKLNYKIRLLRLNVMQNALRSILKLMCCSIGAPIDWKLTPICGRKACQGTYM